jgi:uncharacterized protein (TIGR01244 family)
MPYITLLIVSLAVTLAQTQAPAKYPLPGATNTTRVDAVVACGGATGDEAFAPLKKDGFAAVINLRQASERGVDIPASREAAAAAGLTYLHIPVNGSAPETSSVETFLSAVRDPANQPVYIHCASANRVGAMWLIKRVVVDGWEIPRATEEARAIGLTSEPLLRFAVDYATAKRGK